MITKTTMVVIVNLQNSHFLTLSLSTEKVFQVHGQNQPVTNLPVVDFHSQPREMRNEHNNPMKEILKKRAIQTQQSNERNPKNARDTNVIIQ